MRFDLDQSVMEHLVVFGRCKDMAEARAVDFVPRVCRQCIASVSSPE